MCAAWLIMRPAPSKIAQEKSRRSWMLGENEERQLAVRIIAATWHDIDADVAAGQFREDLLHRLRVGAGLSLPPLSEREGAFDDVLPQLLMEREHRARPPLTRSARDAMANYKASRHVRIFDALPTNASGKVLKTALRDTAAADLP